MDTAITNTPGIWNMIIGAGPIVKLVLLLLIILSLLCWTVIFMKFRRFRQANRANEAFEEIFWDSSSLKELFYHARQMPDSPMAGVFLAGYEELERLEKEAGTSGRMIGTRIWLENVQRSLNNGIKEELSLLESALPILATTGNSAPFIGLFGTVWGIMSSFHSIGLQGTASLATVAPGISEALVATAAGLAAAIPAVMAFNAFTSKMARMEDNLEGFANDLLNTVEIRLFRRGISSSPVQGREMRPGSGECLLSSTGVSSRKGG